MRFLSLKVRLLQISPFWLASTQSGYVLKGTTKIRAAERLVMKYHKQGHKQPLCAVFAGHQYAQELITRFRPFFDTFSESSLIYHARCLAVYNPARHLRSSSDTHTVVIRFMKSKLFGQRDFSFVGPAVWYSVVTQCIVQSHHCVIQ